MSLAGRLTAFFLGALALVLVGFSVTLYLLAHTYLYRQVDERLEAALRTLAAVAEVKPDGVEWEPQDRRPSLGQDTANDQVRWMVHDAQGRVVDRSRNLGAEDLFVSPLPVLAAEEATVQLAHRKGQPWRLWQQRVQATHSPATFPASPGASHRESDSRPQVAGPEEEHKHEVLILTAGVSLEPVQGTLRNLAVALTGLSLGLWLLAVFLGRWLCRRALVPVTQMAVAARAMTAADLGQRLPGPGTGDELEDLGQAFNDLLSRLQEAFERQRRFTGDASHQLRTPLTAVLGQVEVALHRERSAEEYRQALRLVQRQAGNLRQIVESLLFLSRADAEASLPNLEPVDLTAWMPAYLQGWSGHPRRADLRVEAPSGGPLWVRVHAALLGQLLDNLLENACKYSEHGTPLSLRLERTEAVVVLIVEDAGCGIAAEDLPHVFEPFYRSPHARRVGRPGVGLGLAVAQRIAAAFGGGVEVHSGLGQGSRFTLRLPELAGFTSSRSDAAGAR
jgi:two-component system OmpR family sensor kinase